MAGRGRAAGRRHPSCALDWLADRCGERSLPRARQPICPSSARSAMATGMPVIRNPHRRGAGGTLELRAAHALGTSTAFHSAFPCLIRPAGRPPSRLSRSSLCQSVPFSIHVSPPARRWEPRRYKKAGGCVAGGQADASPPWVLWRNASAFRRGAGVPGSARPFPLSAFAHSGMAEGAAEGFLVLGQVVVEQGGVEVGEPF